MFQYRQVLTCMRLGVSNRAIARAVLMDRQKAGTCLRVYTHRQALRDVAGREEQLDYS